MYKIKQEPNDFRVKEIISLKTRDKGKYAYFRMKKESYTTVRAIQHIAKSLNIERKRFGFAGSKDKIAVTEQAVSVFGVSKERLEGVKLKDIKIEFLGYGDSPISLGDLEGNEFEIVIRNLDNVPEVNNTRFVNYFGEQRFSRKNHLIGKAIVKGQFKEAVEMILEAEGDIEGIVRERINNNSNDYVGALRAVDRKILNMYVHAYQSWIWNRAADEISKAEVDVKIPLVGFSTELKGEAGRVVERIMREEGISFRDFIIRQIPELSSEGDERELFAEASGLEAEEGNDELNDGKKKIKLKFRLKKGSYATIFVKSLFS